jgi:tetratricopeptide (TPR) repeat protein
MLEEPQVNPLEITTPDPLLPQSPEDQTLSPEVQLQLRESLDELNAEAAALLNAGKALEAFDIWYRELRLRRALGYVEEVQALGRVGEIAWQRSQNLDVQLITARLQKIQQEAEEKNLLNLELLLALGQAYQQLRLPQSAIAVYQKILDQQRQRGDVAAQKVTLKTMAQLYLDWFKYPEAAKVYEELLAQVQSQGVSPRMGKSDRTAEITYLKQLVYIYDQAKQPENGLRVKQQLVQIYTAQQQLELLPALKIAIASDYEALQQPETASRNYQEAYTQAFELKQFAHASVALQKLATLYYAHHQPDYALQVYQLLLTVKQQSYDFYGLMNTYDQIGQIYLEQKNYAQALEAFKKGQELARSLQYQETYFDNQIERVRGHQQPAP